MAIIPRNLAPGWASCRLQWHAPLNYRAFRHFSVETTSNLRGGTGVRGYAAIARYSGPSATFARKCTGLRTWCDNSMRVACLQSGLTVHKCHESYLGDSRCIKPAMVLYLGLECACSARTIHGHDTDKAKSKTYLQQSQHQPPRALALLGNMSTASSLAETPILVCRSRILHCLGEVHAEGILLRFLAAASCNQKTPYQFQGS